MKLQYVIKSFAELTTSELYEMLRMRSEVFVVEQQCAYLDMDNKDQKSYHLLLLIDDQFAGYSRLLPAGLSYTEVSIGRVVTASPFRGMGLGKNLVEASIKGCNDLFGSTDIRIGAQLYLLKFYNSLGFIEEGDPYDEDGIPHIDMVKKN